jgi:hypothetical protein
VAQLSARLRLDTLPEMETTCRACGLRVVVSIFEYRLNDPASLCKHQPWSRCRALMLPTARLPDNKR